MTALWQSTTVLAQALLALIWSERFWALIAAAFGFVLLLALGDGTWKLYDATMAVVAVLLALWTMRE